MQYLLYLIQKNKHLLLFLVLEFIALTLTVQYHSYNKSKFINSANNLVGGWYNSFSSARSYLYLKSENKNLAEENRFLKNYIEKNINYNSTFVDTASVVNKQKYKYISAEIINNDFHKKNNYITINKGEKDSIAIDVAVVSPTGIVGIITNTSSHYSSAISVLNKNFKTNARVKNLDYFGTVTWNGIDIHSVQLEDIPRQANLKVGDTILTGGRSAIFPKNIPIGSIKSILYDKHKAFQRIDIGLFNDITQVTQVYLIKNLEQLEIKSLEQKTDE